MVKNIFRVRLTQESTNAAALFRRMHETERDQNRGYPLACRNARHQQRGGFYHRLHWRGFGLSHDAPDLRDDERVHECG